MPSSGFTSRTARRRCCTIPATPRPGAGWRCADIACRPARQRQRLRVACLRDGRRPGSGLSRQPLAQPGAAPTRGAVVNRDGQRAPAADRHNEAPAAGHARVEQVAREQGLVSGVVSQAGRRRLVGRRSSVAASRPGPVRPCRCGVAWSAARSRWPSRRHDRHQGGSAPAPRCGHARSMGIFARRAVPGFLGQWPALAVKRSPRKIPRIRAEDGGVA